jgi:hypothetical protein
MVANAAAATSNAAAKLFVLRPKTNIKNVPLPETFVFDTVKPSTAAISASYPGSTEDIPY